MMKTLNIIGAIAVLACGCGKVKETTPSLSSFDLDKTEAILVGEFQAREITGPSGELEGEVHRFVEMFRITNLVEIAQMVSALSPLDADGAATGSFSGVYPQQLYLDSYGQVLACIHVVIDGSITVDRNVTRHGILYLGTSPSYMRSSGRNRSYTRATYEMMRSRAPDHLRKIEELMNGQYGEMMRSYIGVQKGQ